MDTISVGSCHLVAVNGRHLRRARSTQATLLLLGVLWLSGLAHAQTKLQVVTAFDLIPPQNPQSPLIQGTDGNFYGTTFFGGPSNAGTVFQVTPAGVLTILHAFVGGTADGANPSAGLIQGTDGNFYGTTSQGGPSNAGTVFQLTPDGSFTILHGFAGGSADGAYPYSGLIQGSDGNFYGTTSSGGVSASGVAFQLTSTGTFTLVHVFAGGAADGANPSGGLIQGTDGNFYGTTLSGGASGLGTIFQLAADGTITLLHAFGGGSVDGANPFAGLIQGGDGNFYGTTTSGGNANLGTVFQLSAGGNTAILYAFAGGAADGASPYGGLIQGSDGNFYGTTYAGGASNSGIVFRLTPGGALSILHTFVGGTGDGASPYGNLLHGSDGNFYGTTSQGGTSNAGTIFQVTPNGTFAMVQGFGTGTVEGAYPYAGLIQGTDGNFYGTTSQGGVSSAGTVIQVTPAGTVSVMHAFQGGSADGSYPYAGVIQGADGNFYGTASQGGGYNSGVAFQLTAAGTYTILHTFSGGTADGANPYAGLLQGADGNFYGTTFSGGASNAGTVFQLSPAGVLTLLHTFAGGAADGANPYGGLIQGSDGNFYGTTSQGGPSNAGTAFQLTPGGGLTILHAFAGGSTDGAHPQGGLIQGSDGNFYGTTSQGGISNAGTVFRLAPDGTPTVLHAFTSGGSDGATPYAGLIQGADGNFYGTTSSGGVWNLGIAFQITPLGALTVLHEFTGGSDGASPWAPVIRMADGSIYGTTYSGGDFGGGVVFVLLNAPLPTITWSTPADVTYGTALSGAQLDAAADVPGTFTYSPAAGTVLGAGAHVITAVFTPSAALDYGTAVTTVSLNVSPATPSIAWTAPASIPFGQAIDGTQLNATANLPGTFTYTPPAGTVLGPGPQTLSVTFTPTDLTDYTTATSTVILNVTPAPSSMASGNGNEHPLQFTPKPGYRGLVLAGYGFVPNPYGGYSVIGNCSYYIVMTGSGRGARTSTINYNQTCTWDLFGNLLTVTPGAPAVPQPLVANGTQTIYAFNGNGGFTGTDSALPFGGFVSTPGAAYSWITPNPHIMIPQALYTFTATLQSNGSAPLNISAVQVTVLNATAAITGTTCIGQVPVGSTCAVTVTYDPTAFSSPSGLAYDTLTISVSSDAGLNPAFVQAYEILLAPGATQDN